ncbi:DUF4153 domain-containing protein [Sphingopyxis yananensis]|uniref:DUF4153 domain-containing protein n=1 Tax=Sphingopyxis yananensis TaxID=2886687 RepID=UPI001D13032A|nr:DUF4153 domain-containing protein [Sphingopyxis yananensis]MCC2603422.1 DUF4153 domain-containing protein [Sphingopyxis yananensis]
MTDQTENSAVGVTGPVDKLAGRTGDQAGGRTGHAWPKMSGFEAARLDDADDAWPMRPWILAAICAVAGLAFYHLVEGTFTARNSAVTAGLAAFVAVSSLSFALGVERRRWTWAAGFSLFWGAVIGFIMWRIAGYAHDGHYGAWPVFSAILAALIATPFFQTRRDVAADRRYWKLWQLPYARLHNHAWNDAVIGAAGVVFAGITLLLLLLIGGMFNTIGIKFISKLMEEGWFIAPLAGAGFGGAVGLLRERDRLVSVMQRLVMVTLSVLAPVLAVAAVMFLLSLLGTGLGPLWASGFSASVMMLLAAVAAVLLANAVIGNVAEDSARNPILLYCAAVLAAAVLPFAVIAAAAMLMRIGQYGWTPERLWGAVAVLVALGYGVIGVYAVARGRAGFAAVLRPLQQILAIKVMVLAALLALPLVDFGGVSARSQVARLKSGTVSAEEFDWTAMAFDYGPTGRTMLQQMVDGKAGPKGAWGQSAKAALAADNRWSSRNEVKAVTSTPLEQRMRILPDGAAMPDGLVAKLKSDRVCESSYMCAAYIVADNQAIILSQYGEGHSVTQQSYVKNEAGAWRADFQEPGRASDKQPDLKTADIRLETVTRKQLLVDGTAQQLFE